MWELLCFSGSGSSGCLLTVSVSSSGSGGGSGWSSDSGSVSESGGVGVGSGVGSGGSGLYGWMWGAVSILSQSGHPFQVCLLLSGISLTLRFGKGSSRSLWFRSLCWHPNLILKWELACPKNRNGEGFSVGSDGQSAGDCPVVCLNCLAGGSGLTCWTGGCCFGRSQWLKLRRSGLPLNPLLTPSNSLFGDGEGAGLGELFLC